MARKPPVNQLGFSFGDEDETPRSTAVPGSVAPREAVRPQGVASPHGTATAPPRDLLAQIVEQIARDTATLNDTEYPDEITPNRQFYVDRIASMRAYALEVQSERSAQR